MTSLRSFQNEIEQIRQREIVKQRPPAKPEQEKLEKSKDVKKTPVKPSAVVVAVAGGDDRDERKQNTKVTLQPARSAEAEPALGEADDDSITEQDHIQVRSHWITMPTLTGMS